jgi:alkaline phosphatase D
MSRNLYLVLAAAVFALPGSGAVAAARTAGHDAPAITHGVVVGDVTARSAVLWARGDREGTLKVHLSGGRHERADRLRFRAADDYTGQVLLAGLRPDTTYRYRLGSTRGSFETAPEDHDTARVRLAFGGDVAGQNVCRDAAEGFPIMDTIRTLRPDVFVGLGDMIYADNACDPVGRYGNAQVPGDFVTATDLAVFLSLWLF